MKKNNKSTNTNKKGTNNTKKYQNIQSKNKL